MTEPRRFSPPWSVDDPDMKLGQPCFIVRDHNGHALAYVYFEVEPGRRSAGASAHLGCPRNLVTRAALRLRRETPPAPSPKVSRRKGAPPFCLVCGASGFSVLLLPRSPTSVEPKTRSAPGQRALEFIVNQRIKITSRANFGTLDPLAAEHAFLLIAATAACRRLGLCDKASRPKPWSMCPRPPLCVKRERWPWVKNKRLILSSVSCCTRHLSAHA